MNEKKYRWILYTIVAVVVTTIIIQVYWNYKNYQTNKQQLINDVQLSLDKAVDDYYADLAENTTIGVFLEGDQQKNVFKDRGKLSKFFKSIDTVNKKFKNLDDFDINTVEGITVVKGSKIDSMSAIHEKKHKTISEDSLKKTIKNLKRKAEDFKLSNLEVLTSKIVVSIKNDTLDTSEIYKLVKQDLDRKKIFINYDLIYNNPIKYKNNTIKDSLKPKDYVLTAVSKSTFLPKESTLTIAYVNETKTILKRSLTGILISTVLVLAVISCLFYLLKIIKNQKQLAEVKNDLISNITHEFKTPIATIGVALESLSSFNALEDKDKTQNYLKMSSIQLEKLTVMVEKILETATLDTDKLELNKDTVDVVDLINELISHYKIQNTDKEFNTQFETENYHACFDVFHIENALNNILDNAVKYGGSKITVTLKHDKKNVIILISDTGNALKKGNAERIFEQFYRVPKGNTHDVKGFGIGLYYTKSIIEKHGGTITLNLSKDLTTFKIILPNGL